MSEHVRIVMIDDDEDEYVVARSLLAEVRGTYELSWVGNYNDGLSTLKTNSHDVCLLDLQLGARTGLELLREARANGCHTPIIMLTGHGARDVDVEAMHLGAVDFLEKQGLSSALLERSLRYATERREMAARLMFADRMASLGMLAAGVAHEINNPLTYIVSNLGLALDELRRKGDGADSELVQSLREASDGAERVRVIVRDLASFSRHNVDTLHSLDLVPILESSLSIANNIIKHRARVVREYAAMPRVLGSEARVGQVFLNLIVNAAQAIPAGHATEQTITIRTSMGPRGEARIEVSDTGCGMTTEVLDNLFRPFFSTKRGSGGTGLGLSISHGIVLAMGGEIIVHSEVGRGSTFTVALPSDAPGEEVPVVEERPRTIRGRVLVIDDERGICNALQRVLGRVHDVTVETDAAAALARLRTQAFDVVLCDLMMPCMSGMDLYAKVCDLAPAQARAFVFMTGGVFTAQAEAFLEAVDNRRVEKPFNGKAVQGVVDEVIAQGRTVPAPARPDVIDAAR